MRLAERICDSSLDGKAFLCNSGTEANECAIKLARKHAHDRGIAEPEIVVLEGAFHGRTMGAVSATPGMAANESFAPYLPGFVTVPRDDPDALRAAVGERTAAVMLEPIQGESGIHVTGEDVIAAAREACDAAGALLVFDEIQAGMGRTGSLWAYEQLPARPDVMTTAKALGGGMPVGACVAAPDHADTLQPGDHGSTFAGGPLVAAAALAAFDVIDDPALLRGVRERGGRLARRARGDGRGDRGAGPRPDAGRRPAGRERGRAPRRAAVGGPDRERPRSEHDPPAAAAELERGRGRRGARAAAPGAGVESLR